MKVLVATASKYGATTGIGGAVATELRRHGHDVVERDVEEVRDLDGIDAVVLGSAVYMGRWRRAARDLVQWHREGLVARPLWLFSSGPLGDPLKPDETSPDGLRLAVELDAVQHATFAGKLDRGRLNRPDRAVVAALRAPEGDFREWAAIAAWAAEIARSLERGAVASAGG